MKISLITLTTRVQVINLFSTTDKGSKRLECTSLESVLSFVLYLPRRQGVYPRRDHLKGAPLGIHVHDDEKSFIALTTRVNVINLFVTHKGAKY